MASKGPQPGTSDEKPPPPAPCPRCQRETRRVQSRTVAQIVTVECPEHGLVASEVYTEVRPGNPRRRLQAVSTPIPLRFPLDLPQTRAALYLVPDRGGDGDGWLSTTE